LKADVKCGCQNQRHRDEQRSRRRNYRSVSHQAMHRGDLHSISASDCSLRVSESGVSKVCGT